MFRRKTTGETKGELSIDYLFMVPTHYGQITLGLRDSGNQLTVGRVSQEGDRDFYRIVGKEPPLEARVNAKQLIAFVANDSPSININIGETTLSLSDSVGSFDTDGTVNVNGRRRSLSDVAEELWTQKDLAPKDAGLGAKVWGEHILPNLTLWGPVLAGGYSGLPFGKVPVMIGGTVGLAIGILLTYAYALKRRNNLQRQDEYHSLAAACRSGLLELGIDKGFIPSAYPMRGLME